MERSIIEKITKIIRGRSIFLIGMMGCGKSKTGSKLAELLSYKYVDLDLLIENLTKKSIYQIFHNYGERKFRDLESECLKESIRFPSLVISTGGGVVTKPENWGILRQGITIWIDLKKEIALERLKNDLENRPLLHGEDLDHLYTKIFQDRQNLYSQADLRIEVKKENIDEVANKIINSLYKKITN